MTPNLITALDFLEALIHFRLANHFGQMAPGPSVPVFKEDDAPFTHFILQNRLSIDELVILTTAFSTHIRPDMFDKAITEFMPQGGDFPQIGGVKGINSRSFIPTGETAIFLLGGEALDRRLAVQHIFGSEHFFNKSRVVYLEEMSDSEPAMSGRLILNREFAELFLFGIKAIPAMSSRFPAQHLQTQLEWDDLVLTPQTRQQLREIEIWLAHHHTLANDWGMGRKIKPGYRALFYGPPGTGKTAAASVLGKHINMDVFRIDLSAIVSKYIGETEKNLAGLFERAAHKNWILFFDEADALFGKRTGVRDAHDKYANQEVSYLLQRVEDHPGLIILASNFKSNMDDAFIRRFQSVVHFPVPRAEDRLVLWQKTIPDQLVLADNINLKTIAEKYELTGANIVNIVQYCALQVLASGTNILTLENLLNGIQRELLKENKIM